MKMRKLFCIAIAALTLLCAIPAMAEGGLFSGSTNPAKAPESEFTMSVSPSSSGRYSATVTLNMRNKSKYNTYSFGADFWLEVYDGRGWLSLKSYSYDLPAVGYSLAPGKSMAFSIRLTDYYGMYNGLALPAGYYRIGKLIQNEANNAKYITYAELTFSETGYPSYPSYPSTDANARYATTRVNVRKGPSTKYSVIGVLNVGDKVTFVKTKGKWSEVVYNGRTAYVFSKYLSKTPVGSAPAQPADPNYGGAYYRYATTRLNVRYGPGTNYAVVGALEAGERVYCLGTSGNWTRIYYNGNTAYVSTAYLSANQPGYNPYYPYYPYYPNGGGSSAWGPYPGYQYDGKGLYVPSWS